jgi:hypothetical protein
MTVKAYLVKAPKVLPNIAPPPNAREITTFNDPLTTYIEALRFYDYSDIVIRFGVRNDINGNVINPPEPLLNSGPTPKNPDEKGYVDPVCGEVVIQTTTLNQAGSAGAWEAQMQQFNFVKMMWTGRLAGASSSVGIKTCAESPQTYGLPGLPGPPATRLPIGLPGGYNLCDVGYAYVSEMFPGLLPGIMAPPSTIQLKELQDHFAMPQDYISAPRGSLGAGLESYVVMQQDSLLWTEEQLGSLGWAGAARRYNKVAQLNVELFSAVSNTPYAVSFPSLMEEVKKHNHANDGNVSYENMFDPYISRESKMKMECGAGCPEMAMALNNTWRAWEGLQPQAEGNAVKDTIYAIFGLSGLFDMAKNNDVHPLAQLSGVGKSLIDSAVRNFGFSAMAFFGGGVAMFLDMQGVGSAAMAASSMAADIAMMGLAAGFILYYIVPFLPFMYFFFAVGAWVKTIFEAMVGVPLWALAHIRIDGNGLPGDAAMGGYYLLLEIFLRPILMVFGLVAGMMIFAAQVNVLHDIWQIVVNNVAGADRVGATAAEFEVIRSEIDALFYTIIYAIIVYLVALSSFKLIDLIPNHILRWIGQSVSTFAEQSPDPADNLTRNTMIGTQMLGGGVKSALGGGRDAVQGLSAWQNSKNNTPPP